MSHHVTGLVIEATTNLREAALQQLPAPPPPPPPGPPTYSATAAELKSKAKAPGVPADIAGIIFKAGPVAKPPVPPVPVSLGQSPLPPVPQSASSSSSSALAIVPLSLSVGETSSAQLQIQCLDYDSRWLECPGVELRTMTSGSPWPWCAPCSKWCAEEHMTCDSHVRKAKWAAEDFLRRAAACTGTVPPDQVMKCRAYCDTH